MTKKPCPIVFRLLLVLLLAVFSGCAHLEERYDATCENLIDLAQNLDGFFSDPREDEFYNDTRWKIGGGVLLDKNDEIKHTTQNKLKIALPGTKETWGLLIGGSTEHENPLESGSVNEPSRIIESTSPDYSVYDGTTPATESYLRVYSKRPSRLKWDFDVGLKYNRDWEGFARLRGKINGSIGRSSYYFAHQFFWRNTQEEFGMKTQFELDQSLHPCALLREFIDVHYHHVSDGMDIYWGVKLRTWAGDRMAVGLEWVNFMTTDPWLFKYSEFICRFRRSIGREWFEMELTPRIRMKRVNGLWEQQTSVELIFALIFDADHVIKKNHHQRKR